MASKSTFDFNELDVILGNTEEKIKYIVKSFYGLNICVLSKFIFQILTSNMTVGYESSGRK